MIDCLLMTGQAMHAGVSNIRGDDFVDLRRGEP
jgi:hypothetical protein